jgi:putative ribosome biogenesis GTPase RsgA
MAITNAQRIEIGELSRSDQGYNSSFRDTRTPGLISFVGQTGAGKSALIKLIIWLNT